MEKARKRKLILKITLAIVLTVLMVCGLFYTACYALTEYLNHKYPSDVSHIYDLKWIEGKTFDQIVDKYGEFTRVDDVNNTGVYTADLYDISGDCIGGYVLTLYFNDEYVCIKTDVFYHT